MNLLQHCFCFMFWFWPSGMWDLISLLLWLLFKSISCAQLFVTPQTAACKAPLSSTISQSLLKFMPVESVILSNYLILWYPLLLLPLVFPSIIAPRPGIRHILLALESKILATGSPGQSWLSHFKWSHIAVCVLIAQMLCAPWSIHSD